MTSATPVLQGAREAATDSDSLVLRPSALATPNAKGPAPQSIPTSAAPTARPPICLRTLRSISKPASMTMSSNPSSPMSCNAAGKGTISASCCGGERERRLSHQLEQYRRARGRQESTESVPGVRGACRRQSRQPMCTRGEGARVALLKHAPAEADRPGPPLGPPTRQEREKWRFSARPRRRRGPQAQRSRCHRRQPLPVAAAPRWLALPRVTLCPLAPPAPSSGSACAQVESGPNPKSVTARKSLGAARYGRQPLRCSVVARARAGRTREWARVGGRVARLGTRAADQRCLSDVQTKGAPLRTWRAVGWRG